MASQAGNQRVSALQQAMGQSMNLSGMQEDRRQFDSGMQEDRRQFESNKAFQEAEAQRQAQQHAASLGVQWSRLRSDEQQRMVDNELRKQQLELEKNQSAGAGLAAAITNHWITEFRRLPDRMNALDRYRQEDIIGQMIREGADINAVYDAILKMPEH